MKNIFTLGFLFLYCGINAQIEVNHTTSIITSLPDIYNLEITNRSGNNKQVSIHVSLRNDNELVYEATTNQFSLFQSVNIVSASLLQPISVSRNNVTELNGTYQMDLRLIDNSNQVVFADRIRLSASSEDGLKNPSRKNSAINFSGRANIYGQISNMQGVGSAVPQEYLRAEIHPDLLIHSIPIGLDILWSTEQNAFRQSINQVAFRFDTQQFKRKMNAKMLDKVKRIQAIGSEEEIDNLKGIKDKLMRKKFPDLEKWKTELNNPEIQSGLKKIQQLESLDQILTSKEVKENLARKSKLEAIENLSSEEKLELKKLLAFSTEIQKLKTKAESVRPLVKTYEQYKSLGKRIKQAKKYQDKEILKDPAFIKSGLKNLNVMSKGQQFLNGFDAITIGTTYPYFSRLSLSSLSVNGVNVEWNPGSFYLATCYGKSARQTLNTDFTVPTLTLPQTTLGAKIGMGSPYGNHFHLVMVDVKDEFANASLTNPTKPQSNRLLGTDAQFSLFNGNVELGGELMTSLLTRDNTINTDQVQEFDISDIPLNKLFGNVNNSSSFDIAWRAFSDIRLFQNKTKVKASVEKVGSNYFSLGSPTLLNDVLRWRIEGRQSFFKNKLSLSAYWRQDANNLDPLLTSSISTTKSFGLSGSLHVPKYPSLTFSYAPYAQNNKIISTNEDLSTDAKMLNVSVGYPYKFSKELNAYTQLTYLSHDLNSNIPGVDYNLKMYGINQSFNYKRSNVNITINYTPNQIIGDENQKVLTINTSGSLQFFKKWNNTIGFQYLSIKNKATRKGFFIDSIYSILPFADLQFRLQRNIYATEIETDNFNDIIGWGGLRIRW